MAMGLDAVEMIMEVEEHFGITITDEEAQGLYTVGDVVSVILKRVQAAASERCFCLPAFLALRRATRDVLRDDRVRIRPGDRLVERLSATERQELWKRLPTLLKAGAPLLVYPTPVRLILGASVALVTAGAAVIWSKVGLGPASVFLLCSLVPLAVIALSPNPCRTVPPEGWRTFGEITRHIAGSMAATKKWNLPDSESVLAELRPIIASWLGVEESKVVPEARFIEDLHWG